MAKHQWEFDKQSISLSEDDAEILLKDGRISTTIYVSQYDDYVCCYFCGKKLTDKSIYEECPQNDEEE